MTFYYTLIRQETEPTYLQPGWIWIKQSIGASFICIAGEWIAFRSGSPTTDPNGIYWYEVISQSSEPTSIAGQIWHNSNTNQEYIYLGGWTPLVGG